MPKVSINRKGMAENAIGQMRDIIGKQVLNKDVSNSVYRTTGVRRK